ncbi:hypothetical protein Q4493_15530 [Colwellia sp. 1_MG-2023]|uniref:hypothetical protein n=1 Tax=Colwellia sp. 1_MG-2023 TaxID=3062649 RepID=UPI0026E120C9|nr:hypothetical protein [Colwellia sp. 1_MG-2023]MDO6447182.1 hypothetical protein [Colwellia sp. 1_MG-2023]
MSKPVLILMHGVGVHTSDSFKAEVVEAAKKALKRYPSYQQLDFEAEFEAIHSISYDSEFEAMREAISNSASTIENYIKQHLGGVDIPNLASQLINIDASLGQDRFINTHALDVLLYLSLFGEKVRGYVNTELLTIFKRYPIGTPIHLVCHSLGTSVAHDALNELFTFGEPDDTQLRAQDYRLHSYWTFANVSNLVTSVSGLTSGLNSKIKPGSEGVISEFYNIYHELDPICFDIFKRFDPPNNNSWIDNNTYSSSYRKIVNKDVSRKDTHSIQGYIEDPNVSYPFFYTLIESFDPSQEERDEADTKFVHLASLVQAIKNYQSTGNFSSDLKGFIKAIKALGTFTEGDG